MARCAMLEMISYSRWKRSASSSSRGELAAAHDLEHDVAAQPLAAREEHRGEIAGRDLLDDGVAGHSNRGGFGCRASMASAAAISVAPLGAGVADRLEQGIAGDAGERQIVLRPALERPYRRYLVALFGEYDAVGAGLDAQQLRRGARDRCWPGRLIAEVGLQDHGVGSALLDEAAQRGRRRAPARWSPGRSANGW